MFVINMLTLTCPLFDRMLHGSNMGDEVSCRDASERELEAMAVIRDVILIVKEEIETNLDYRSEGLGAMLDCADAQIEKAYGVLGPFCR